MLRPPKRHRQLEAGSLRILPPAPGEYSGFYRRTGSSVYERKLQNAGQALGLELEAYLARSAQSTLDEARAETFSCRLFDGRPATLDPDDLHLALFEAIRLPADAHASGAVRKRSVFHRVRRQLVQNHRQEQGIVGAEPRLALTLDQKSLAVSILKRRQRRRDQLFQRGAVPALERQKVVGSCKRPHASAERRALGSRCARHALRRHRLHRCERIL